MTLQRKKAPASVIDKDLVMYKSAIMSLEKATANEFTG